MEITLRSNDRWMDKAVVPYSKKIWKFVACHNLDRTGGYPVKWNKFEVEREITDNFTHLLYTDKQNKEIESLLLSLNPGLERTQTWREKAYIGSQAKRDSYGLCFYQ